MAYKIFSERFSEIKKSKGLSLSNIAKSLDINPQSVYRYTDGMAAPTLDKLVKLADLFDVSIDYLVGRTNNPMSHKTE